GRTGRAGRQEAGCEDPGDGSAAEDSRRDARARLHRRGRTTGAGRLEVAAGPGRGARRLARAQPTAERRQPESLALRARLHRRRRAVRLVARRPGAGSADQGRQAGGEPLGRREPEPYSRREGTRGGSVEELMKRLLRVVRGEEGVSMVELLIVLVI